MNDYIINPAWFYWLSVADGVKTASIIFLAILAIAEFCLIIAYIVNKILGDGYSCDDENNKIARSLVVPMKCVGVATAVLTIVSIFAPSRDTLIEMQIAKYATHENAEWTLDALKNAVDYIVNAIQTVNGG